ncbi:hypothetical protein SAMN04487977_101526 [Treponema bryantii]|uniref:Uncharacterized protein n=1 Tax=Treponema bryantii TaxID=163 RepID=A0A1H9AZH4_9SPIR|nr:hypothetical protein SAMN04487977_101526 [Treponema bryantii]
MNKKKPCKYYEPPTYSTCSICKVEYKYASCYGDKKKCRYKAKEKK